MAQLQDRVLKCVDCSADFVFSAGEQQFYLDKNFTNEPRRCKICKAKRHNGAADRSVRSGSQGRLEVSAICSQCGQQTTLPFRPTQGRPVFCKDCFRNQKAAGVAL
jgi:CxxC-x17-CxxC domain-containing protein